MDGRDLVRSIRLIGTVRWPRFARSAVRRSRTDARGPVRRGAERARVPGELAGAEPQPGGGVMRFARSELRVMVAAGGAVFWGWDGAGPEPSYALAGACPGPDTRAELEPDKDGGWQVVSERLTVAVSRHGAVEVRTPGGAVLRRDLPPRWWEPIGGGTGRWLQRSEVPADARFFGLGGRSSGLRLRDGTYPLGHSGPGGRLEPGDGSGPVAMPVRLVVSDAGTHLVFHDSAWEGRVTLREGVEGDGSGHDRPGISELRMDGGPLRCWVVAGTPARVLRGWTALTGAPALPPSWALGPQHVWRGDCGEQEVRRIVDGYGERGLPLSVLHVDGCEGLPGLPRLAGELREAGVRLVSVVRPGVGVVPGNALYESGKTVGAFLRDVRGNEVRGALGSGACVYPDFTAPRARAWWGSLYEERLAQGFSGVWHEMNEPVSRAIGGPALSRAARLDLEGRGGDHREARNVYGLGMARAGYEALRNGRSRERPFLVSRSGWAGIQRYGGVCAGEVPTGWPGLRAALSLVLGLGLCGVPYAGTDVPGAGETSSAELYLRWFQLGSHLPLFRTGAAVASGHGEPWAFGPQVLGHVKATLAARERLLPYFVTLSHLARLTGAPYVRPVWWGAPEERALRDCEDAFLLGDCLLVAPVLESGADRRAVRLPRGRWYDTATGKAYDGPGRVLLEAPLSRIPVLARAGAVIPVRGEDGGLALEVWRPVAGRTGGGLLVKDPGDGWERAEVERFTTRTTGSGRVVVERKGGGDVGLPVLVRGG